MGNENTSPQLKGEENPLFGVLLCRVACAPHPDGKRLAIAAGVPGYRKRTLS